MYEHFIVLGESYRQGKRIAYHYSKEIIDRNFFDEFKAYVQTLEEHLSYAVHRLSTESESFDSVIKKDSYFKGIELIETKEAFFSEIIEDKKIKALDIAKYLLSQKKMSHLKLQKLIYLAYEDYLLTTGKSLFPEAIQAWKYGPVVFKVYEKYKIKANRYELIEDKEDIDASLSYQIAVSKILKADDFSRILDTLDRVLDKFGDWTADQLVSFTHLEGKPWQKVYEPYRNNVITNDIILKNACLNS